MNLKRIKWFDSPTWHVTYLSLLFVVTAVALYFALPQDARFRYEFQKGRPWMHETLIAPFDFAIMKSDAEIKIERDSLLKTSVPYFNYLDSVGQKQLDLLSAKIDEIGKTTPGMTNQIFFLREKVISIFKKIYEIGILEQSVINYPSLAGKNELNIVHHTTAKREQTILIYSLKSAYTDATAKLNTLVTSNPRWEAVIKKINPEDFLAFNLVFDQEKTVREEQKILENLSTNYGIVQEGERIVSQGDVISPETYTILESLKYAFEKNHGESSHYNLIVLGRIIFIMILLLTLFLFIYNIRRKLLKSKRDITFTMIMMTLMILFCHLIIASGTLPIYIVPFTALALIIRTFLDARLAIFVNTIAALIIGFMVPNGYEFVLLQIPAGSIAVISQNKMQRREQIILTSLIIFFTYSITYIGISLVQEASFRDIDWSQIKWFGINSILTLITYLLVFILEKSFGFVSDVTLIELSYSNSKLLRKLAEEAPGTFQHSLQVANLAEEVILRIGGNSLLVRAGALYHDIGKLTEPQYFIENQVIGINPHDKHSSEESAKIIKDHVSRGVELAHKHKLPEQIIDFIRTHHGTTKTGYFYQKSQKMNEGEALDEKNFTYPGPVPSSRETTVIMLADSIEAASRSLEVKNAENIKELIDRIVKQKTEAGQLEYAPITFKELTMLKEIFLEKLLTIYHIRINYPPEK
jgi:cyclic-di-AMP phosphodiesterase PgpH